MCDTQLDTHVNDCNVLVAPTVIVDCSESVTNDVCCENVDDSGFGRDARDCGNVDDSVGINCVNSTIEAIAKVCGGNDTHDTCELLAGLNCDLDDYSNFVKNNCTDFMGVTRLDVGQTQDGSVDVKISLGGDHNWVDLPEYVTYSNDKGMLDTFSCKYSVDAPVLLVEVVPGCWSPVFRDCFADSGGRGMD